MASKEIDAAAAGLPAKVIGRVWLRMTEIYGHKWTSSYGDSDRDGTWAKALADMSLDDLKAGFIACITSGEAWPPSLPEFRAMCRPPAPAKPVQRENEAMYRVPPDRQIPHLLSEEARSSRRAAIAALRSKVKA
jgi:hypothetical protein